jgi:hypothetical protein
MRYSAESRRRSVLVPALAMLLTVVAACHQAKAPVSTQADVTAAQDEARKELDQARIEARKDVKSAVKVSGGEPKNVALARATGTFDIAMAQAEGDHKVAIAKCMRLDPASQQPCKDQADAAFQAATTQAKAMRGSRGQPG